ncbi:MAG: hypothetical protein ACJ8F1_14560 [Polyangia bacterium]
MFTGIGLALGLALVSMSEARASTYNVDTSSTSAMSLNANDGYCSLAEAVASVNAGHSMYNCPDQDPSSTEHTIWLREAAGKPYASFHYVISALTITTSRRVMISGLSGAPFIDSTGMTAATGYSAFVIKAGAAAFFQHVNLTNIAGSAGGRLLENRGTLQFYGITISKGDVTGSQHALGIGGALYNGPNASITFAENSTFSGNKAKRGGAVYNDAGNINELAVTISGNSATMAGGGIFNISTTPAPGPSTNGIISTTGLILTGNSAKAGGGIFNRGTIDLNYSSITSNTASGTGSNESCTGSSSCDGAGGGVVSAHKAGAFTRFSLSDSSTLSSNTASGPGGAIYNVGVLNLGGLTISSNHAQTGAALYVVGPTDGTGQYCSITGDNGSIYGPVTINNNTATSPGFSIVAGGSTSLRKCIFSGLNEGFLTASGNSSPNFCQSGTIDTDSSRCPQP